ncbi:hypothetical protein FKW77_000967 [Venturia effusa]|uniref:FAS1 domain-containing protein n=1 Tax=Venturia effusa TaxID=50376 RepID=A0A517LPF9_9PEZI|nr:hypothetical protein FKW77_000967 [Venturia effusa]
MEGDRRRSQGKGPKRPAYGYLKGRRPHAGIRRPLFGFSTTSSLLALNEKSSNGLSSFALYLAQFPALSDQVKKGNVTVLAPSDAGIDAYLKSGEAIGNYSAELQALIQYHVLPGRVTQAQLKQAQQFLPTLARDAPLVNVTDGQKLEATSNGQQISLQSGLKRNSSLISTDDLLFAGSDGAVGIVHIIDSILTLPVDQLETAKRTGLTNYVDLVASLPRDPDNQGSRDITIFAPNGTVPYTSNHTAEALFSIEAYHVLMGAFFSSDLLDRKVLTTSNGASVTVTVQDGDTYVNDAKIVSFDYLISAGVMHVLDRPLSPQRSNARPPLPSWKSKLPTGAYIGIAVGVVLVFFTITVLLWHFVIRRRRDRKRQEENSPFANTHRIGDVERPGVSGQFFEMPHNPKTFAELHSESAFYYELDHTTSNKEDKKLEAREIYELGQ